VEEGGEYFDLGLADIQVGQMGMIGLQTDVGQIRVSSTKLWGRADGRQWHGHLCRHTEIWLLLD
jgi:hypothetical protein